MNGLYCYRWKLPTRSRCMFRLGVSYISRDFQTINEPPTVCIVGSGPAGFYTAQYLLKSHESVLVDIYDKLVVPFGLVRFGVAPDHPETKNCINQFTTTAQNARCRFVGNVHVGKDLSLKELKSAYDAIILCYGAEEDRKLQIPGEECKGVYSARRFVEWYNGLPASKNLKPDLSSETAVILGQGNVALDVARILLKPVDLLEKTDICEHALHVLRGSNVKKVYVIGRRGPLQVLFSIKMKKLQRAWERMHVSFTIKELREMTKLKNCRPIFKQEDFTPIQEKLAEIPRQKRRLFELLCNTAFNMKNNSNEQQAASTKEFILKFCRSPVEILSTESGKVSGVKFEINKLIQCLDGSVKAQGTGNVETLHCGLVFRSIGYRSVAIDDEIPFEDGVVACSTKDGHVRHLPGVYCCGWVRTGPSGVILSTLNEGRETAKVVSNDLKEGKLPKPTVKNKGFSSISALLHARGIKSVSFTQWQCIDKHEQELGSKRGKPREKIVDSDILLNLVHGID